MRRAKQHEGRAFAKQVRILWVRAVLTSGEWSFLVGDRYIDIKLAHRHVVGEDNGRYIRVKVVGHSHFEREYGILELNIYLKILKKTSHLP